jgi:hypothetical protein
LRRNNLTSVPPSFRQSVQQHIPYAIREIKIESRSFYVKDRDKKNRASSYCTYTYCGVTRVGQIYAMWFFPDVNKLLVLVRYICKTKSDTLYYKISQNVGAFHVIDVLDLKDQMVVCRVHKHIYLSEFDGVTFTVSDHDEDKKYPMDNEEEELQEFIQYQVDTWL